MMRSRKEKCATRERIFAEKEIDFTELLEPVRSATQEPMKEVLKARTIQKP